MTTIEFCMMLVMLFLTWHLWRMSKRIRELELPTPYREGGQDGKN